MTCLQCFAQHGVFIEAENAGVPMSDALQFRSQGTEA